MPLARIDIHKDAPSELVRIVSDAIYGAMVDLASVPLHDKFQVITRHASDEIIYPEAGYLGVKYSSQLIIIQVTWVGGRSMEVKRRFSIKSPPRSMKRGIFEKKTCGSISSTPAARIGPSETARCNMDRSNDGGWMTLPRAQRVRGTSKASSKFPALVRLPTA
jgi:Tautomerase enzyme